MKKLFILIQFIIILCLYAPLLNMWVSPSITPYLNAFSLAFPIVFILNLIFLICWCFTKRSIFLFFLCLSLPSLFLLKSWFPFYNFNQGEEKSDLAVMTYNVRYFYDDYHGIQDLIVDKKPDVFFFQEMGANPERIIDELGKEQPYFFENYNSMGIASIYPIIETNKIRYQQYPYSAVYGDIAMPQDTIRLINVYLESLHLDQESLKQTSVDSDEVGNQGKKLISKVAIAAKVHEKQIELIQDLIKSSPHPVILGGDLNAVPNSYEYYELQTYLKDAFPKKGNQIGHTFRSFKFPLKLDFVMNSENIEVVSYEILKRNFSDHYPTLVKFDLPK